MPIVSMDSTLLEDRRIEQRAASGSRSAPGMPVVEVAIEYCLPGNYEKVARSLASAVRREFPDHPLRVRLIASSGGVFEVRVDGKLVHSKRATFRLPSHEEVFYHVGAAASGLHRETASS